MTDHCMIVDAQVHIRKAELEDQTWLPAYH